MRRDFATIAGQAIEVVVVVVVVVVGDWFLLAILTLPPRWHHRLKNNHASFFSQECLVTIETQAETGK
jgi:hypothetical protein